MKRTLYLDGLALWSPGLPGWPLARAALRGDAPPPGSTTPAAARPAPTLLAANERRRAPDSVLLALEVASQACADCGHDRHTLASVFASTHGDLPITDALCRTLASDPLLLSPTRFHHSVHNAASGYWAIGSGSRAASTALSAGAHTFATAWLEAASQCEADQQPVLLVIYDTEACGPLVSVNTSRGLLAMAWVLSPVAGPRSAWMVDWSLSSPAVQAPVARTDAAQVLSANASASALPLMEALAMEQSTALAWPLSTSLALHLALQPLTSARANATAA